MALIRWIASLFADTVPCQKCKRRAYFDHQWGRYSVYQCKCGTATKIKTYD